MRNLTVRPWLRELASGCAPERCGPEQAGPGRTALAALLAGWLLILAGPMASFAATVTLSPVSDAYVNNSDPAGTYNNAWLVAGRSPAEFTPRYRSFLRFDLSGIPGNATISGALLRLNLQAYEGSSTVGIEARRVLATWSSATLTWNQQPPTSPPVITTGVGTAVGSVYQWPIPALVQSWVAGQFPNYGVELQMAGESTAKATRTFASFNHATAALRPELVITYSLLPDIELTPTTLNFGSQLLGTTSASQTVTILNTGSADLHIAGIQSTNSEFLISDGTSLPATVVPSGSWSVEVRFAPVHPGIRNTCIAYLSDDPDEPSRDLICTGLGLPELSRSTFYDGSPGASSRFTGLSGLGSTLAMTVEAWVRREDPSRTEAILSHNRSSSFWFGFAGPHLRFYRGGGQYADSTSEVEGQRWTHVAAAYDGSQVKFFIDGQLAGAKLLGYSGPSQADTVQLAGDEQGANFYGLLDEVRLWDHSRSEQEIREAMFEAAGPWAGLQALFPAGGPWEALNGRPGEAGAGVVGREISVLREPLRIPRAVFAVNVDGQVDPASEYLGALEMVIRYEQGPDATVFLVHDGEAGDGNLYAAFAGLHDVPDGRDRNESWVGVGLDPRGSGAALASPFHLLFKGFLGAESGQMFNGDGLGGFNYFDVPPASNGVWNVEYYSLPEFGPFEIEFRIPKSEDWLWRDTNRIMLGHFDLAAEGDNFLASGGVVLNSPATWSEAIYVENTNVVPLVSLSGYVWDNDNSHPIAGQTVELVERENGVVRSSTGTDVNGRYRFDLIPMVGGRQMLVRLGLCADCLPLWTRVATNDIQPVITLPQTVAFPAPVLGTNHYARTDFYLRRPIGPISLAGYSPSEGVPRLRLRDLPEKLLPEDQATKVTLTGANLHQAIQVFLYSCLNLPPENLANAGGCELGQDYFEARIVARANDDSWVRVEVPHVPRRLHDSPWPGPWGWAVRDNWWRPNRGPEWQRLGGFVGTNFALRLPPYPLVSGFEFDNEPFDAVWDDFIGVFRENAYVGACVGGAYPVRFEYLAYFPTVVFLNSVGDGSCNGMAGTSQLLHRLELDAEDSALVFEEDDIEGVHFAAGFQRNRRTSYVDRECEPVEPKNLQAHIRVNHCVQFSDEYIQAILDQLEGQLLSIAGDPALVLDRVREHPADYVISMIPEIGEGHVVTPYAVLDGVNGDGESDPESSKILVYDNNYPADTNRFIEITPRPDRSSYRFPRADDIIEPTNRWVGRWSGRGIYAIPISVFQHEHTMPGLLELGELLYVFVFGGADGHYTDGTGGEWGWRADGSLVDSLPGARSITPVGGANSSTRSVMLVVPMTNPPPPSVAINVRSNQYGFHAANGGRLLQLERHDGVPGTTDQVRVADEGGRLASMRYTPQEATTDLTARLAFQPVAGQHLLFELTAVAVAAGAEVAFAALPAERGVELANGSGAVIHPRVAVWWLDSASGTYGTNHFGPLDLPAGALQRLLIQHWPLADQLKVETDLDRDGTPETASTLWAHSARVLSIARNPTGNQLTLSWPGPSDGFLLEESSTLGGPTGSWSLVSSPYQTNGTTIAVQVLTPTLNRFYRLHKSE